jgi:hypothetical protein
MMKKIRFWKFGNRQKDEDITLEPVLNGPIGLGLTA